MIPVILSAGEGSRVGKETTDLPKWFLKVSDKRVCDYQLDALCEKFDTAYVVLGHGFTDRDDIGEMIPNHDDIDITALVYPDWDQTENSGTAAYALDQISVTDHLLLICGDLVFDQEFISDIVDRYIQESQYDQCSAVAAFDGVQDEKTAVEWNKDGSITDYGKIEGHEEAGVFILNKSHLQKGKRLWEQNKNNWFPFIFHHVKSKPIVVQQNNHYEINTDVDLSRVRKEIAEVENSI